MYLSVGMLTNVTEKLSAVFSHQLV